ncbi:MAG TPA: hypothetical protein VFQ35_17670 [Polyangiaceae bacterium]|nr:hypothetical protein [Polyangiaceae bacterium]
MLLGRTPLEPRQFLDHDARERGLSRIRKQQGRKQAESAVDQRLAPRILQSALENRDGVFAPDFVEEALLGLRIEVNGAEPDPRLVGDASERRGLETIFAELTPGDLENPLTFRGLVEFTQRAHKN